MRRWWWWHRLHKHTMQQDISSVRMMTTCSCGDVWIFVERGMSFYYKAGVR